MWRPLMEIEAEDDARRRAETEAAREKEYYRAEQDYQRWRQSIAAARGDLSLPADGVSTLTQV